MAVAVVRRNESLITVVEVTGEIDPASAPQLQQELRETIESIGPQVVLDFSRVSFMDSTGLHLLLAVKSWCEEAGGYLRLTSVHGAAARVMDICAFDQLIDIAPPLDSDLEASTAG